MGYTIFDRHPAGVSKENCENLFAAGDVCAYPAVKTGQRVRIEHWDVAMQQGRVAANNMLGNLAVRSNAKRRGWGLLG